VKRLVPVVVIGGLVALGWTFRGPLAAWFTWGPAPLPARAEVSDAAVAAIGRALDAEDRARAALAEDRLDVAEAARTVAAALREAEAAGGPAEALRDGAAAADRLAAATDLAGARAAFGDVNRALVALAGADPRLRGDWHVFRCPMAKGYPQWLQRGEKLENPYMGRAMPGCGDEGAWPQPAPIPRHDDEIAYYTCPMHPSVQQPEPGNCPVCGMTLTPVTRAEKEGGVVVLDAVRRQEIGVRTGTVDRGPMRYEVHAAGRVTWDESQLHDVSLELQGWIRRLDVSATGQPVRKGQRLFTLYSPELYAAEQEYLLALRGHGDDLARAAERKLRLWDLTPAQIAELAKRGEPQEEVPFYSPASGFVIEKDVVEGAAVQAGQKLFRIAGLDPVWVEADVYEADLPRVQEGQAASVTLSYLPGESFEGHVAAVYPYLDPQARTGRVRIALPNPKQRLKPAMYADVALHVDLGERLRVPEGAVVYTGPRRLVFVDLGEGHLQPQPVKLGAKVDGYYEVLEGLHAGQTVVTSGNFLVSAESRIRSAAAFWGEEDAKDPGHEHH
jgi:Cu(I)/Ag(I) efflux system membrane fusion protein